MGLPVLSTNWSGITAYLDEQVGYPISVRHSQQCTNVPVAFFLLLPMWLDRLLALCKQPVPCTELRQQTQLVAPHHSLHPTSTNNQADPLCYRAIQITSNPKHSTPILTANGIMM